MISTTKTNDAIHIKIILEDQIRRFLFVGTEFTSLKETISRLVNFNDEFVLKYQDDESDYVTLEGQEDLMTALSISPKLLRISVEKKNAPPSTGCYEKNAPPSTGCYEKNAPPSTGGYEENAPPSTGGYNKMNHGRRHGGNQHYHHQHREHPYKNPDWRKQRLEKKLTWVNQCLADLTDESKLTPRDLWKKQRLLKKQQKLESFMREGNFVKPEKKKLTVEEEQVNCGIKLKIMEVKTEVAKVKARQRELKIVLQNKPGDAAVLAELNTLKDRKGQLNTQKKSLWDQLHS